jgi:hypothetical protein
VYQEIYESQLGSGPSERRPSRLGEAEA